MGDNGTGHHTRTFFQPILSPFTRFQEQPSAAEVEDDLGSVGSISSIGSVGSILSIGSAGSVLSIGSAGSVLSIGSAGSVLSIGSVGSIASLGSAFSIGAVGGWAQHQTRVVEAAATALSVAALLAALRG